MPVPASSSGTSPSLLARARAEDPSAWDRLVALYSPLVFHWCRRARLQDHDIEDVFQEVFKAVLIHLGRFRKESPSDSFRGWLFAITRNKLRDHFRREGRRPDSGDADDASRRRLDLAAPLPSETPSSAIDGRSSAPVEGLGADQDAAALRGLFRAAIDLVRAEFREQTWMAFWSTAVDGRSAPDVATELGMSAAAVRVAKSRVLRRLREEMRDDV